MFSYAPSITLSFAVEETQSNQQCSIQQQAPNPLTKEQRLNAIESYALIAASHSVSNRPQTVECDTLRTVNNFAAPHTQNSSLGLSLRLQDTFRNYLRMRVSGAQIPNQNHNQKAKSTSELRQLFAAHDESSQRKNA